MSGFRDQQKLDGDVRPIIVNVMNFAKAAKGAAGAPVLRRCAHAVPRIRPRAARPAVRRDLSAALRHRASRAISSSCPRSSTSIGWSSPRCCAASRVHAETGAADAGGAARTAARGAHASTRASRRSNTPPRRWSISSCISEPDAGSIDVVAFEKATLERIGMPEAIVMRHRTPHFQHIFSGDGYSAGLLQLSLVGSARRRRLRRLRGDRRHLRPGDREAAPRLRLFRRQSARPGRGLSRLPRPRCRRRRRCSGSAGWTRRREGNTLLAPWTR